MELEKEIEKAIAAVISDATFSVAPVVRAFLVDDEPDSDDEEREYPAIQILCGTATPYAQEEILFTATAIIDAVTNLIDDPKRQTLSSILGTLRNVLTQALINPELPAWINLGGIEQTDGEPEIQDNEQRERIVVKCFFAAVPETTTTSTTTTTSA